MAGKDKFKGEIHAYDRHHYLCVFWTISSDGTRELKHISAYTLGEAKRLLEAAHDEYMTNIKRSKNYGK